MKYIKKFEDYVASFKDSNLQNDDDEQFKKAAKVTTNESGFVIECNGKKVTIESGIDEGNEEVPVDEITEALEKLGAETVTFENTDGEKESHPVNEFLRKLNPLRWKLSSKHRSIAGAIKGDE
jgi:hypothetical protein